MARVHPRMSTRSVAITAYERVFANPAAAEFLGAASSPASIPRLHGVPEVVVTGRANAGKSTLFNAVLGRIDLLRTSKKAGRTKTLNFYRVGSAPGKLVLVDSPGYGLRGRPEWGELWDHYFDTRKQLRRVYIVINAYHGVTDFDAAMLRHLNDKLQAMPGSQVSLQAILTQIDTLRPGAASAKLTAMQAEIFENAPTCLPAILTAAAKMPRIGIEDLRRSIADACALI